MEYYRNRLGSFGISGDFSLLPVACLSGGQKSRVAFTQMCMSKQVFIVVIKTRYVHHLKYLVLLNTNIALFLLPVMYVLNLLHAIYLMQNAHF